MRKSPANLLILSRKKILIHLSSVLKKVRFNYRTFGTEIEPYVIKFMMHVFRRSGFISSDKDYYVANSKNDFPDFELRTKPLLAIEIKSGNIIQKRKGSWIKVKNSQNDMGTLLKWPDKLKHYEDNIYCIFIIYNVGDKSKDIVDVQIDKLYRFIGLNSKGLLSYREKDGNLRPKDFYSPPKVIDLKMFKDLLDKTIIYRSKRIIKKHKGIIEKAKK